MSDKLRKTAAASGVTGEHQVEMSFVILFMAFVELLRIDRYGYGRIVTDRVVAVQVLANSDVKIA